MKKTLDQLMEIDTVMGTLYKKNPELRESKFGYAYQRFYDKNIKSVIKKLQENLADLRVEHALEDKTTKELLKDDKGNFKYTKEGQLKLSKAERELTDKTNSEEIEVEPYIATSIPELNDYQKEVFAGILIPETSEKKPKQPLASPEK